MFKEPGQPTPDLNGAVGTTGAANLTRNLLLATLVGQAPGMSAQDFETYTSRNGFKQIRGLNGEQVLVAPRSMNVTDTQNSLNDVMVRVGPTTRNLCNAYTFLTKKDAKGGYQDGMCYPYCTPSGRFQDMEINPLRRGSASLPTPHMSITGPYLDGSYAKGQKGSVAATLRGLEKKYHKEILGYRAVDLSAGKDGRTSWFVVFYQDAGNTDTAKVRMAQFAVPNCPQQGDRGMKGFDHWDALFTKVEPVIGAAMEHYFKAN